MNSFVTIRDLHAAYGHAQVLFGLDLSIERGKVNTLMGRNGMGKTTTVRCLMGLLKPTTGQVTIAGQDMTRAEPHQRARKGLGLVPEGRHVFPSLTVSENLIATARAKTDGWSESKVYDAFPRLGARRRNYGFQLSGGEQQMLAIGRALMTNPELLILDEATEGLAPLVREEIWQTLGTIKETGLSILLIDKNLGELSRISDHFAVIEKGAIVWQGTHHAFQASRAKVERYLHI